MSREQRRLVETMRTTVGEYGDVLRARDAYAGGMQWMTAKGHQYLTRYRYDLLSGDKTAKSLGRRSAETEKIHDTYMKERAELDERIAALRPLMAEQARMAKALRVSRTPSEVGAVLRAIGTSDLLDQLQGRRAKGPELASGRSGTPFLEGPTVTVAGAALLQRVATAVGNVGGTVQSSQVDVLGTQAKDGFVGLVVSCEMEQPALQKLLYDIEVGMPFLFVEQLVAQSPQEAGWIAGMTSVPDAAYLQTMFVDQAERGTGIGAALVRHLHARLDGAGIGITLLHHSQVNPLSAPFWYRMGYRPLWTSWEARPASALR